MQYKHPTGYTMALAPGDAISCSVQDQEGCSLDLVIEIFFLHLFPGCLFKWGVGWGRLPDNFYHHTLLTFLSLHGGHIPGVFTFKNLLFGMLGCLDHPGKCPRAVSHEDAFILNISLLVTQDQERIGRKRE